MESEVQKVYLPNDEISACKCFGSEKNGVDVERKLPCTITLGDKQIRRHDMINESLRRELKRLFI